MTSITDPLPGMLAERDRLIAEARAADLARAGARQKRLDGQAWDIEAKMARTRATTLAGLLAQVDIMTGLVSLGDAELSEALATNIRAAVVELVPPAAG